MKNKPNTKYLWFSKQCNFASGKGTVYGGANNSKKQYNWT